MNCIVIADQDARIKWATSLALYISDIFDIILYHKIEFDSNLQNYIHNTILYKKYTHYQDIIINNQNAKVFIIALGGGENTKCIKLIHEYSKDRILKPFIITGFNGLTDCSDKYGLLARLGSDLICVNSLNDYNIFSEYLKLKNIDTSILFLLGLSRKFPKIITKDIILFVEQINIPKTYKEKQIVINKLINLAKLHIDEIFVIKLRSKQKTTNSYLNIVEKVDLPKNIKISYEPIENLLSQTKLCISFSSTVIIESLILGIDCRVLSDFGIKRQTYNNLFIGSGIFSNIEDIFKPKQINKKFKQLNCQAINDNTASKLKLLINQPKIISKEIYLKNNIKRKIIWVLKKLKSIL